MIRVDTDCMQAGVYRLRYLRARLDQTRAEMKQTRSVLRGYMEGSAVTDATMFSLLLQIQTIEKRIESLQQLTQVLNAVEEQYRECEKKAERKTIQWSWSIPDHIRPGRGWEPAPKIVLPTVELNTLDRYISPIIVTGENTV